MRWVAKENEDSPCPGLKLDDIPDSIPANIHIKQKQGIIYIASENMAGVLPCKNGNEIIIEPKYKKINPIEMLMYSNNISGVVVNRERLQEGKSQVDIQTVADALVEQLRSIRVNNRKFKRVAKEITSRAVVGKVDWIKTYRRQKTGKTDFVNSTIRMATYDIPENALISAAAKKIMPFYSAESEAFDILVPWMIQADIFPHSYNSLFSFQAQLNEKSLSGPHAFYYAPVMLSKIILGFNDAEMLSEENDSILFNMPGLYEEYIRTGFQRIGGRFGYSIQKGLTPRSFLFYNGECELIPDITVYDGSTIKALLDVKYKVPDSKDYYQIFAYMKFAGLDTAYVISPAVEHNLTYTAFDGAKIWHVNINDSRSNNLESTAEEIIRGIA